MKKEFHQLIAQLKADRQDFEFYPTTDEIIQLIADDVANQEIWSYKNDSRIHDYQSFLDCGAGNGQTLAKFRNLLSDSKKYFHRMNAFFAIEKSQRLISLLPDFVSFAGADFYETDLTHQQYGIIFSNPPYSEFEIWTEQLIRTANCCQLYLVIPKRWENSVAIKQALAYRNVEAINLGEFDFENADRSARAKVNVLRINYFETKRYEHGTRVYYSFNIQSAFDELFAKEFNQLMNLDEVIKEKEKSQAIRHLEFDLEVLVRDYLTDLQEIQANYRAVSELSPAIFSELEINLDSIKNSLKQRLTTLRNQYWNKLFNAYEPLSSRFTGKSLNKFNAQLGKGLQLDFNLRNIYALTEIILKNANVLYDDQIVDFWKELASEDYISAYKSNEKIFDKWEFRYNKLQDEKGWKLDYRLIYRVGSGFNGVIYHGKLASNTTIFSELYIIAKNLGYNVTVTLSNYHLTLKEKFEIKAIKNGKEIVLAEVKLHGNGNAHIRFDKEFMLALNVEVGRILGWITSPQQAADEMDVKENEVAQVFGSNFSLKDNPLMLLGLSQDEDNNEDNEPFELVA